MKTLIITVGTRQVGWRCKDGVVRCLGADGDRGHPPHIEQLYTEFGEERGYHGVLTNDEFRWAVRHLGNLIYQHCQQMQDFDRVELLMDSVILTKEVPDELSQVILWGTDQPEGIPWNFRRNDTLWLAHLMAGRIQQLYPQLKVQVWNPEVAVNQVEQIQRHLQDFLLNYMLAQLSPDHEEPLTIQIQTKGSAPQIASSLEICAAALMRQCTVEQLVPVEPESLFEESQEMPGVIGVQMAPDFKRVSLGQYFWPVEQERILSAWKRGDFAEAKVWLTAHRDRYQCLYELAGHLALATNWQLQDALKALQGDNWLDRPSTKQLVPKHIRNGWRADIKARYQNNETSESKFLKLWESRLLIYLNLMRQNYTAAFIQFVQTLERLLFWRFQTEDWIREGYITPRSEKSNWSVKSYNASFGDLRHGWQKLHQLDDDTPLIEQLKKINERRNGVVHRSNPLTLVELAEVVSPEQMAASPEDLYAQMESFLQQFCPPETPMPERSLLQDLYNWGIEQLQAASSNT
jgi:hypothetical protein